MILYNLKTQYAENESEPGSFVITKFDNDLVMESTYQVSINACTCPQFEGRGKTCRHMRMLPALRERVDTAWFYCYEDGKWYDPTNEAAISDSIARVNAMKPFVVHAGDPPPTDGKLRRRI